jgi:hypothetical protein
MADADDVVFTLIELQSAIDRMAFSQESAMERLIAVQEDFSRDALAVLRDIEIAVSSLSNNFELEQKLDAIARDIEVVADRYRAMPDDDWPANSK